MGATQTTLVVLACAATARTAASLDAGSLTPFLVPGGAAGPRVASAALPHVRCLFAWGDAAPPTASASNASVDAGAAQRDAVARVAALAGACAPPVTAGGFSYRVCVGANVTQWGAGETGGDGVHLGAYDAAAAAALPPHVQQFGGGARCGATPRSARVALGCGPDFAAFGVAEPQTCYYELRVQHPSLCGANALFPGAGAPASTASSATAAPSAAPPRVRAAGALPPHLAYRERQLREARARRAAADGAAAPAGPVGAPPAAPPATATVGPPPLSAADVPGVGGRSLTLRDDSRRGGRRWAGSADDSAAAARLDGGGPVFHGSLRSLGGGAGGAGVSVTADAASGPAPQASWVLDLHHALLDGGGDGGGGSSGGGGHAAALSGRGGGAAVAAGECAAYATDDLRLGTGVDAGRGATAASASAGAFGAFALVVLRGPRAADAAAAAAIAGGAGGPRLRRFRGVVARGADRGRVPVVDADAADDGMAAAADGVVVVAHDPAAAARACATAPHVAAALAAEGATADDCLLVALGPPRLPGGIEFVSASFEVDTQG